jgi:membrane protease YdiL (CAAX protease family)
MTNVDVAGQSRLSPHVRGHLLRFEGRPSPEYPPGVGGRLLFAALLLEAARLATIRWLLPTIPLLLLSPLILGLALLTIRFVVGLRLLQIGLLPWREWSQTEKSYFLQILVIANVVFATVLAAPLREQMAQHSAWWMLSGTFVPYLFFGFYQEVVYRGMVQTELVRRKGTLAGILIANVLYTFGPLHWEYFASRASLSIPMFAAIFGIGLFFGVLYKRSGNLWIVATFHAIGNAYIVTGMGTLR